MHKVATWTLALWLLTLNVSGWCCRLPTDAVSRGRPALASHARACCCRQCARREAAPPMASAPGCQGKCHEICRYLPAAKASFDDRPAAAPFEQAVLTPGPCAAYALAFSQRAGAAQRNSDAPPLRLHLLHQILLI